MRFVLALSLAAVAILPAACSNANAGPAGPLPATLAAPDSAQTYSTMIKLTTQTGKPVAGVTVTLSKNRIKGPVIATGATVTNGTVSLSGFKLDQYVCAWAAEASKNGRSQKEVSYCSLPFPSKAKLVL